ncbi:MAG: hypothetical protein KAS82_03520 [Bacteroidales bacterium]|nr:hypothetical protein [Bacteroidales bacterium]
MMLKRAVYLGLFLIGSVAAQAQINVYLGGNLQGNYSWIRGDEPTMEPGFGGGISFIYWEHEYWFLKTGIDYNHKTSSILEYPDDYGVTPEHPDDKIIITFTEQTIGVPLTIYFRPYEKGANTLLIAGTLNTMIVASLKESSEEYGDLVLKGTDVEYRVVTNLGIGVGYQRQLDKHMFLNILPSFNIDLRADRAFNSITLTAELIFGIY